MIYYVAINAKMDRATVTGFPLKDRGHATIDGRVRQDPSLFDFQEFGRAGN